jgi:bifunctional non-homologous end joining protein LigD
MSVRVTDSSLDAFEGPASTEVEVEGRRLRLTNLDRVYWPETGFTKRQTIAYYMRVAPALLPHLRGRPLTLRRFPEGVNGLNWYQVQCRGRPRWLPVHEVRGQRGESLRYCVVNDLPSLVWVANLGTIELHPFLSLTDRFDEPIALVFDLDPGAPAGLLECCTVALRLRDLLDRLGLAPFAKTSGSLGLHLYVPLESGHRFDQTKAFARAVARVLAEQRPDEVTDRMTRSLRPRRVLVDWLQNDPTRSTVAPYSLRAMPWPVVSTPLDWSELERAHRTGRAERLVLGPDEVLDRLARAGDLFRPVLELAHRLDPDRLRTLGGTAPVV